TINSGTNSLLSLSGNNSFTGPIVINSTNPTATTFGVRIIVSNSNALGASGAANGITFDPKAALTTGVTVANMGISLTGGLNINKNIVLNGGAGNFGGLGEIDNLSGNNTWSGQITLNGGTGNIGPGLAMITATSGTITIPLGIAGGGAAAA